MRFKRGAVIEFRVILSETEIIVYEVYIGCWNMKVIHMSETRFEVCNPQCF